MITWVFSATCYDCLGFVKMNMIVVMAQVIRLVGWLKLVNSSSSCPRELLIKSHCMFLLLIIQHDSPYIASVAKTFPHWSAPLPNPFQATRFQTALQVWVEADEQEESLAMVVRTGATHGLTHA